MTNLYRLVYTSFRKPECDEKAIQDILNSCKSNNPKKQITGLLLRSNKRFLQYMEGEKEEVEALYEHVKMDERHGGVNMRNFEPIDERVFLGWEMGYQDLSSKSLSFNSRVTAAGKSKIEELVSGDVEFNDQGMRLLKLFLNQGR